MEVCSFDFFCTTLFLLNRSSTKVLWNEKRREKCFETTWNEKRAAGGKNCVQITRNEKRADGVENRVQITWNEKRAKNL